MSKKCGGLALWKRPEDFDPVALAKGTDVEFEHTCDPELAMKIAMDHLMEDKDYYEKLAKFHKNKSSRVRIYDASEIAQNITKTFKDRPAEYKQEFPFSWPSTMQNVGDSLAVAYGSDKWQPKSVDGKRQLKLYKHIAESRNRALVRPGILYDYYDDSSVWNTEGPFVDLKSIPFPKHFSILGYLEEIDLILYSKDKSGKLFFDNDNIVKITVSGGMLGASEILWSEIDNSRENEPFIFAYSDNDGVMAIIFGEELDIEKDGIVG